MSKVDHRLLNAVISGKQKYKEDIKAEEATLAEWLNDNLFDIIKNAAAVGFDRVSLEINKMPACKFARRDLYAHQYIEGIGGLNIESSTNGYITISWAKNIG